MRAVAVEITRAKMVRRTKAFADGLNMGYEGKKESRMMFRILT